MRRFAISILYAGGLLLFTREQPVRAQSKAVRYPQATLRTAQLTATLYEPDSQQGYYRSTRFDWSGLVSKVVYANHTFFSEFRPTHDPLNHDDICGTAEEFGIESPPSYAQAKPGEPFIKIGIGVLERLDGSDYSSGGVLCPEPFVKVSIAPGQTQEWTTTYRFNASANASR